ncbi:MAG: hypothetical protein JNL80_04650 [Phycisphaerae bacterium]|nr:hypothetical protein [Phycisphaerae bacterium]
MTSSDPMSREELIELAPLDAYGLLDDYEAALFNRSFHHAPATVQAEIRALQAQLAEDGAFLSNDEPRGLLRQKVLIRIAEEVDETAEQLKPLATIGGMAAGVSAVGTAGVLMHRATSEVVGVADTTPTSGFQQDETMRELVAEIRARASIGDRDRSTPYWRAAAFFLAAGLVASLYFLGSTMRTAERIAQLASGRLIGEQLREAVPDLNDFIFRDSDIRTLTSVDRAVDAAAFIFVNPETRETLFVAFGLNGDEGPYTLRSVDDQGNATVIKSFNSDGPASSTIASISPELMGRKFELLNGAGKVVLRSA